MPWQWTTQKQNASWNKAGRPAGSGTTTKSRRDRIRAEAQERDRLAAEGDAAMMKLKAEKEASKAKSIAKQEEARLQAEKEEEEAQPWKQQMNKRKKEEKPCQKAEATAQKPCQKAEATAQKPCQKAEAQEEQTVPMAEEKPCQKAQGSKEEPCQEAEEGKEKPCQKAEDGSKENEPCQEAEDGSKESEPCQKAKGQEFGPSEKQKQKEEAEPLTKGKPPKPTTAESVDWGSSSYSSSSSSEESSSHKHPAKKVKGAAPKGKQKLAPKRTDEPTLEQRQNRRIAVDWNGVLVVHDYYDPSNTAYLQKLKDHGYEVHLLSYCGVWRSKEVWQWAWHEWDGWESVSFTWSKCGKDGKATWCVNNNVSKLIDDNQSICRESQAQGIRVYPIVDRERERGDPLLKKVFRDFKAAVMDILEED